MRLLVHDFAGYSFPAQLSSALAARGHRVLHLSAEGLPGPKGGLPFNGEAGAGLEVRRVSLSRHFRKYSPFRRLVSQRRYALDLETIVAQEQPDVVLSGDTPIDVQAHLLRSCSRRNIGFVHWVQDDYSLALHFFLRRKIGPVAARLASLPYQWLDGWVARNSGAVISISPGFLPRLRRLGARSGSLSVIENWGPINEIGSMARQNPWREFLGVDESSVVFLYSGSMGLKHRPELIYMMAKSMAGKAHVVVVSEGVGRQYLEEQPRLSNLTLLDFQPYERLPEILASADVLLATLETNASEFAVPSKVLSYLCAGRPVLLAAPSENLAADVVRRSGGGVVVDSRDSEAWVEVARQLACDAQWRITLGMRARQYAEANFDIGKITDRFEAVLTKAAGGRSSDQSRPGAQNAISTAIRRWLWTSE